MLCTKKKRAPSCPLRALTSDFALDAMAEVVASEERGRMNHMTSDPPPASDGASEIILVETHIDLRMCIDFE
jgi:hypothetical protein